MNNQRTPKHMDPGKASVEVWNPAAVYGRACIARVMKSPTMRQVVFPTSIAQRPRRDALMAFATNAACGC
jgi:hypothetical protein